MIRVWIESDEMDARTDMAGRRFEVHDFYADERMGERDRAMSFILRREWAAGRELEFSWRAFAPGERAPQDV